MKKVLSIAILFVMVALIASTCVSAATAKTLADDMYKIAAGYGMTDAEKVKVEHYLADHELSDEQATQIVAKTEEVVNVMKAAGKTNVKDLSDEDKATVTSAVKAAAAVAELKIVPDGKGTFSIVDKNDKVVEKVEIKADGTLAYTGSSVNVVLIVSSVAVLTAAAFVVVRKRLVNA